MHVHDHHDYIRVWRFADAPRDLRDLSGHGGDEDWLAVIPPRLADEWIPWLEPGSAFGRYAASRHPHPVLIGYVVVIGAHA